MRTLWKVVRAAVFALLLWIAVDMLMPAHADLHDFDPLEVSRLETDMWRAYYDHQRPALFLQLGELLRRQYHMPVWRSITAAYYAAHAAVVFQPGKSREDYNKALPDLVHYYQWIRRGVTNEFDPDTAARLELEWWIVHRQRVQHQPHDLVAALADLQSELYQLPPERFEQHARARAEAMLLRDDGGQWTKIRALLDESWTSLHTEVNRR